MVLEMLLSLAVVGCGEVLGTTGGDAGADRGQLDDGALRDGVSDGSRDGLPDAPPRDVAADISDEPSVCTIGGISVAADARNPSEPCQICSPSRSATGWSAAPTPVTLASGLPEPFRVAVSSTTVYWTNLGGGGSLMSMPLAGGAITTLVAEGFPYWVSLGQMSVYFTTAAPGGGPVLSVPMSGGAPTTLATGEQDGEIIVTGSTAYFTGVGSLSSVDIDGGTSVVIATHAGQSFAVDSFNAYYTESDSVLSIPLSGGMPTTLAAAGATGIAVDSTTVYWTSNGFPNSTVMSVPISGGASSTLVTASSGQEPSGPAVDAEYLYWSTPSAIERLPVSGGAVATFAVDDNPQQVVLDSTCVYWVNDSGNIKTAAK